MGEENINKDIISFISVLATFFALLSTLISPEIFNNYFITIIGVFILVLVLYLINYFKKDIERHEKEINKINDKLNIYKDISDLKANVGVLMNNLKIKKRGQAIPTDLIIKLIQIAAIIFAGYIILKALKVI